MRPVFGSYNRAQTFQASDAPLFVVDTDLVIRDVNPAYVKVMDRAPEQVLGTGMFEAFPENPADSQATSAADISAFFERVFREARRDYMPLHRYDIASKDTPAAFTRRFWTGVATPLRDETGHLIGALHHFEDVTAVVEPIWDAGPSSSAGLSVDQRTWNSLVTALVQEALGHRQARTTAEQLQHALTSRIFIEQAKGLIAAREGVSIDQAFTRLRQHARRHQAALHEVARAVVELGMPV
jgi:two-component system, response regulator / RNA-binding antiterminator